MCFSTYQAWRFKLWKIPLCKKNTPKSQIIRIKDPIPILTFQVQSILTNVLINVCMYTPL